MRGILSVLGAERRRRWGSWLGLALLVTLVGGTVLGGADAARRTASAFPDFVHRYGSDVAVFTGGPLPKGLAHLPHLDDHLVAALPAYLNGNVRIGQTFVPSSDLTVFGLPERGTGDSMALLSGHLPTQADQALVGFSLASQAGLHIGSVIHIPFYRLSQAAQELGSAGYVVPHGPLVALHVVGVEAGMLDFPTATPSYTVAVGPSFTRSWGPRVLTAHVAFFRLASGAAGIPRFDYDVNHLGGNEVLYPFPLDSQVNAVESSIHPQVEGWWLFALLAALAGLALVGQALARQSIVERESFPTLSALGCTPRQLFAVGMLRAGVIAVCGAGLSVLVGFLASPLVPVGEARAAEPALGFQADPVVLGVGGLAIVVVVLLLAAYPSWRWAQSHAAVTVGNDPVGRPSILATAAARAGAPPSVLIGVRHALERGRGRARVPVATAFLGTVAAVAALSATSVFSASLTHLLDTPTLYGQGWTVDLGGFDAAGAHAAATFAARLPGVSDVTYGVSGKEITVNGVSTNVMLVKSAKGPIVLQVDDGRFPSGPGEFALGTQTIGAAHAHIGGTASVSIIGPGGNTVTGNVRVVGTVVFPPVVSQGGGLGDGAAASFVEAFSLLCGTTSPSAPCVHKVEAKIDTPFFTNWGMAIRTAPTPVGRRAKALLEQRFANELDLITQPTNLVNFGQAVNFPLLLGAMLALFGAATLFHLLLVSVARRRRELALLKVLGFLRRQAAASVCWQSATVAVVGLVVGIPIGIAVGQLIWRGFATDVGAVPSSVVPVLLLCALGAVVLVCGTAFAALPASLASRLRPAEALREQ